LVIQTDFVPVLIFRSLKMKYLASLILALTLAVTASAGHGVVVQQVRVRPQRVVVQQVRVPRQRVVVQQFAVPHVQQFRVQQFHAQPFFAPQQFIVPQQFNSGCHNDGVLQFNAGGCSSLFR
jgi:hypothetical protein